MKVCISLGFLASIAGISFCIYNETVQGRIGKKFHDERMVDDLSHLLNENQSSVKATIAPKHAYPHQISLQVMLDNWLHFSGGSIIGKNFVLTSAYCAETCKWFPCRLVAGAHNISVPEDTQQMRKVKQIIIHPQYDSRDYNYGILVTNNSWNFTHAVKPIELSVNYPKGTCVTSGWTNTTDVLCHTNVTIVEFEKCKVNYGNVTERMVCGDYGPQRNDLHDFGGPMVCDGVLAGVGPWRYPPPGTPSNNSAVFSNVAAEKRWIQNPRKF